MKRLSATVLLVLSLGCATSEHGWRYTPEERQTIEPTANVSVAVLPFEDRRGNKNEDRVMMCLIPLVPYGSAAYDVPEGQVRHVTSSLW